MCISFSCLGPEEVHINQVKANLWENRRRTATFSCRRLFATASRLSSNIPAHTGLKSAQADHPHLLRSMQWKWSYFFHPPEGILGADWNPPICEDTHALDHRGLSTLHALSQQGIGTHRLQAREGGKHSYFLRLRAQNPSRSRVSVWLLRTIANPHRMAYSPKRSRFETGIKCTFSFVRSLADISLRRGWGSRGEDLKWLWSAGLDPAKPRTTATQLKTEERKKEGRERSSSARPHHPRRTRPWISWPGCPRRSCRTPLASSL